MRAGRLWAVTSVVFVFLGAWAPSVLAENADAKEGQRVYNTYCILCHGPNLINSGSNAPDLRKFPLEQKPRFVTAIVEGKGQGKMPAWGDILSSDQIDQIWMYVKARGKI